MIIGMLVSILVFTWNQVYILLCVEMARENDYLPDTDFYIYIPSEVDRLFINIIEYIQCLS